MNKWTDPSRVAEQYTTSQKLNARISLHARFSTNPMGWFPWVFEQINPPANPFLPKNARILELGCGTGELWAKNIERIPRHWRLTLSDLSWGMVNQASRLAGINRSIALINAAAIPVEDASLDAVIADHMLYHVTNRAHTLDEIRRILKPGGYLFASTLGQNNLVELINLLQNFDPALAPVYRHDEAAFKEGGFFSLEGGEKEIGRLFSTVRVSVYPDSLHITETGPLVDYILSTKGSVDLAYREALTRYIQRVMDRLNGAIDIAKVAGIIIAC